MHFTAFILSLDITKFKNHITIFRSLSNTVNCASYPFLILPFEVSPITAAGVCVIIFTASASGIPAFTALLSKTSLVAMLPAKADRSGNYATPSSITNGTGQTLYSLPSSPIPPGLSESVIRHTLSTPFNLTISLKSS